MYYLGNKRRLFYGSCRVGKQSTIKVAIWANPPQLCDQSFHCMFALGGLCNCHILYKIYKDVNITCNSIHALLVCPLRQEKKNNNVHRNQVQKHALIFLLHRDSLSAS